ncbi:MAG: amidohydrolase family protein [Acidobacteria bacterium]|nr:amidohydrolase family protein [Acidobacteriota bacterium]MBV9477406.1 amidohydrolase family protein [Acidobacteriota bacterium]
MPTRRTVAVLLLLIATLLAAPHDRADAPGVYALTGATIHPVAGPDIPNGTIVIRNGLIEAVGANVAVPPDATSIDARGAHVYPGLIDAQTSAGFTAPARSEGRRRPAQTSDDTQEPSPDSLAMRNVKLSDDELDARRATGVTTIVTAPSVGIFQGQSVVLNLGGAADSRVVKSPAALQIAFNTRPTWTYPDSLMGVISYIRQTFLDAQQHGAARATYERHPAGLQRPPENAALDALQPVLRGEVPVVFVADSEEMMRRAQAIAREFNLRYVLSGARQAYAIANDLKSIPTLVSVKWPVAPADKDDRAEQPLRIIRDRQLAPTSPAALAKSGAAFALVSGSGKAGDFLPGIRKAIENGLSADDALRATTIAPARIFGVDRQLGTLERGKIANVIVSDRPLFDKNAKLTHVFVDGRELRLPKDDKKEGPSAASPIDGTWNLTVRAPQGGVAITVTLHSEDGHLSGTFAGDRGSGDIRGGSFDGTTFDFTISANAQNGAEATDWAFRGKLDGDAISGTVSTTLGNFEFSGSRSK